MSEPPDRRDSDDDAPIEASLARGLDRQPLDAQALARIRAATQAEFEQRYQRRSRVFTLQRVSLAAAVVLVAIIGALTLQPVAPSPVVGSIVRIDSGVVDASMQWPFYRALHVGGTLHVGEKLTAGGAALVRLDRGGTFRVASGTRFDVTQPNELRLDSGRIYFDFPLGVHGFVVRSAVGTVEHLGTQFEVALVDEGMRVRVREGAVRVHSASGTELADAGTEILVQHATPPVVRQPVPSYGPNWAWVDSIAPDFDIEDRPLADFLTWVGRETGRRIDFGDERARELALRTRLHGSVHGLEPMQALDRVLSTTTLRFEIHDDTIRVSSR
jgi:ferric-dicitrate binding protein FerR (iron transport regulator)